MSTTTTITKTSSTQQTNASSTPSPRWTHLFAVLAAVALGATLLRPQWTTTAAKPPNPDVVVFGADDRGAADGGYAHAGGPRAFATPIIASQYGVDGDMSTLAMIWVLFMVLYFPLGGRAEPVVSILRPLGCATRCLTLLLSLPAHPEVVCSQPVSAGRRGRLRRGHAARARRRGAAYRRRRTRVAEHGDDRRRHLCHRWSDADAFRRFGR